MVALRGLKRSSKDLFEWILIGLNVRFFADLNDINDLRDKIVLGDYANSWYNTHTKRTEPTTGVRQHGSNNRFQVTIRSASTASSCSLVS